jgi:hypothetical protein
MAIIRSAGEFEGLAVMGYARKVRLQARDQSVLHAQRIAVVLVEAAVDAELHVARAAVQGDRGGIVRMGLEAHDRSAAIQRGRLRRREQRAPEPFPLMLGRDRHRVQASERGAPVEQDERVAVHLAGALGDQAARGVAGHKMAEAAPRQPVVLEAAALQREEPVEILHARWADRDLGSRGWRRGVGKGGPGGHHARAADLAAQYRMPMSPAEASLAPWRHRRVQRSSESGRRS